MTAWPEFGSSGDWIPLPELIGQQGALGPESALLVLRESLLGLAAAHEHGAVHLDYQPANVLVDRDGRTELTCFAAPAGAGSQVPARLAPYQAPEVRDGMPVSPAGNLYAATAVFFECLTGLAPSPDRIRRFRQQQLPVSVPLGQAIEPLCELMAWGMAGNLTRRPASAGDFVAELDNMAAAVYGPDWHRRGRYALADRVADALVPGTSTGGNGNGGRLANRFGGRRRSFYPAVAALAAVVLLGGTGAAIALSAHFGSKPSNSASGSNQGSPSGTAPTPSMAGSSTAQLSAQSHGTAFTADAVMTPPATTSTCAMPATFRASGTISATTAGTVTYQWAYSSGTTSPVETLNFSKPGTQQITGAAIQSKAAGTGWAAIKIVRPKAAVSNKATYVLDCSTGPVNVSATAAVTPAHSTVSCAATPPTATFTGTIHDAKAGPVSYYWALPTGNGPVQSLTFATPGTESVTSATVAASSDSATESGTLVVLSPAAVSSDTATFSVSCTQPPTVGSTPGATTAHFTVQLTTNQVMSKTVPCGSTPPTFEVFATVTPDTTIKAETFHWVRPDGTTTAAKTIQLSAGTTGSADDLFSPASDNFSGSETLVFTSPATGSWSLALALTCSNSTASASPQQQLMIANNMVTSAGVGSGEIGVPYSVTDTPIGGKGPYRWSATGLPPGVTINASTGTISGTPTAAGGFSVTVTLTDGESPPRTATADTELLIAYTPVKIAAVTLSEGTVGQPYPSVTFSASGGDGGPYSWFIQPDTYLPPGLTLSASGVLSGTPTKAGTYTIWPSVSDAQVSGAGFDKTELTLVINSA